MINEQVFLGLVCPHNTTIPMGKVGGRSQLEREALEMTWPLPHYPVRILPSGDLLVAVSESAREEMEEDS